MPNQNNIESKRIFVGIPVPREIATRIQMLKTLVLASEDNIRWVSGTNLHITLLFLGDIPEFKLDSINAALQIVSDIPGFTLSVERSGVFPNIEKPRIFWMDIVNGRDDLICLQSKIQHAASNFQQMQDDQSYVPHLTIGRTNRKAKLWKIDINAFLNVVYEPLVFEVGKYYLYKSELLPTGPRYTILKEYSLKTAGLSSFESAN